MEKEELKSKIKSLKSAISKLNIELNKLEKLYIELQDTFEEKFLTWVESESNKVRLSSYPDEKKYPLIRKLAEDRDPERHETVYLIDCLEDYINSLEDEKYLKDAIENEWISLSDMRFWRSVAKEMMDNNIDSFVCDW
jgi:hypothetical protein